MPVSARISRAPVVAPYRLRREFSAQRCAPVYIFLPRRGLGLTTQQLTQQIGGLTATALAFIPVPGVAQLAAAAAAAATQFAIFIEGLTGCGITCVQSSQYANQAESVLKQLYAAYFAQPVRTVAMQQAVLLQMQQSIAALKQACSDPKLGTAGQNCIKDRLIEGGPTSWCPLPGKVGCDWITTYVNPVKNDPAVVSDTSSGGAAAASVLSSFGVNPAATVLGIPLSELALPGLLLLFAAML